MNHIGYPKSGICQVNGCGGTTSLDRNLEDHERLPGGICNTCQQKNAEMKKVVADGGVHWRHSKCGSFGAIRAESGFAKAVRNHAKIYAPDPVGVDFTDEECPVCNPKNIQDE